jgi:hypothetical protein
MPRQLGIGRGAKLSGEMGVGFVARAAVRLERLVETEALGVAGYNLQSGKTRHPIAARRDK